MELYRRHELDKCISNLHAQVSDKQKKVFGNIFLDKQEFVAHMKKDAKLLELFDAWDLRDKYTRPTLYFFNMDKNFSSLDELDVTTYKQHVVDVYNLDIKVFHILQKMYGRMMETLSKEIDFTRNEFIEHLGKNTNYFKYYKGFLDNKNHKPLIDKQKIDGKYLLKDITVKEPLSTTGGITKICSKCLEDKTLNNFRADNKGVLGVRARCRDCDLIFRRSRNEVMNEIYRGEKRSSKARGHKPPEYTSEEFKAWLLKEPDFIKLYDAWASTGYLKDNKPSVDRLDDNKSYSFDNIHVITWRENYMKENHTHKKTIELTNIETGKKLIFSSIKETAGYLEAYTSNIQRYIKNKEPYKGHKIIRL